MTATAWDLAATTSVEANTPATLARRLRAHLQAVATQRLPITYQEAAKGLLLAPPNTIHQVTAASTGRALRLPAQGDPQLSISLKGFTA